MPGRVERLRLERAHVPRARREDARRSREGDRRAHDAADARGHHGRAEDAADGRPAARPDAEDGQGRARARRSCDRDGTLDSLPILKCWPEDGGRFITFPLVFTKDPETGMRNIGTYRMQVFDGRSTGMHWQRHKGGAQHYRVAERLGRAARSRGRAQRGAGAAVLRDRADARRARRAAARRVPRPPPHRAGQMRDGRSRGAGELAHRARGLRRAGRAAARRAVRRSHGAVLAAGRLPGLPSHLHHAPQAPDLPHDRRRRAADGGLLPRSRERTHFPADDPQDAAGNRRHAFSGGRHLPQPRARVDRQALSRATRARS